jgi:flagellar protein FlgJ
MYMEIDAINVAKGFSERAAGSAASVAQSGSFDALMKRLEQVRENVPESLDEKNEKDGKDEKIDKTSKLYEQCQELESFLVKNLLNSMRATVQKSGFMDGGFAGGMYEDMLYDEYAKDFTKSANFGFADLAYLELTGQRGKTYQ